MSQHVYRAHLVIDRAGAGLLRDLPLRRGPRTGSAAAEAGHELARRLSGAYLSMGKPSSITPAVRTATIEAFLHATGNLSAATSMLAAQLPSPGARRFTAAQARLTEADEHLGRALERSGARPGQSGGLTLAQRARDRYPLNRHSRRDPDTGDHPARLAMASFPASPSGLARQPAGDCGTNPAPWPRLKQRLTRSSRSTP